MGTTRVRTLDVLLAAAAAAVLVVVTLGIDATGDSRSYDALTVVLVLAAGGVLALHRRAPLLALAVTTVAAALYGFRDYGGGPIYFTWIAAIFALSLARGPGKAWLPAAASTAVVMVAAFGGQVGVLAAMDRSGLIRTLFVSWAVGAFLLGGSVRGRRAERAALEERARHLAGTREEEARRRVAEERVRIARDLHDSVAHSMASISVQAGVGAHVLDERPEEARAALLAIKNASGDALSELRVTLHMLRSGGPASREPTAGLERLPSLVESSRVAGLAVEVVVEGEARSLPPAVDTAAFRIVQESLTNVIRHAGAARATVAVRHGDGSVEIEVTDDGRVPGFGPGAEAGNGDSDPGDPGAGDGGGHGLAGMRERVAFLGGELLAGPRDSGGYRVRARLPL
jgi:signal transduction histidine kinase